ncbi:FAD:protein FMN transferase [Xanthobacter autotrophicus]|uniref:FAD:protein FMN transferase n=1 Tax=Xanthobacter autotrophicus TaxID=280 RepID=UPI00372D23E6
MSKMSTEVVPQPLALRRHALSGPTMGSRWSAVFWTTEDVDTAALDRSLQAAVDRVEQQMTTRRPDSDLERLSAAPIGVWVSIPRELTEVLAAALDIGRRSEGAFDIGVGDLVRAWGFGGCHTPDARGIAGVAGRPSFEPPKTLQLDLAGGRARRLAPLRLDLSGIAKGFGVDELAREMGATGLSCWLVGIDGEMRAEGVKPGGLPWAVAHEKPVPGAREILGVLELSGAAVATSGAYRHRVEVDGRILSHTMDPRRGAPLENDLASVTVLAGTCMAADAWATALLVAGAARGPELARRQGLAALFVQTDGEVLEAWP